jgi:hypothetical protein
MTTMKAWNLSAPFAIVSEDGFAAAEVSRRPDGLYQFRGYFSVGDHWDEVHLSGLYADAATAEGYAREWVKEESATP